MKKTQVTSYAAAFMLVVLTTSALVYFLYRPLRAEAEIFPDVWPSFEMVYEESYYPAGLEEAAATDIYKFVYEDIDHWTLTTLDSTEYPGNIGDEKRYFEGTYSLYAASMDANVLEEKPDAWVAPNQWLVPDQEKWLVEVRKYEYLGEKEEDGSRVYRLEEVIRCYDGPPICPSEKTDYAVTTEITFNSYGVPVEITSYTDGVVSRQVTTVEFTLTEAED